MKKLFLVPFALAALWTVPSPAQTNLLVKSGGTLIINTNITVHGAFAVEPGGAVQIDAKAGVQADAVAYGGSMTLLPSNAVYVTRQVMPLYTAGSYSGAFANVILPSLPVGLFWSNRLAEDGSLELVLTLDCNANSIADGGDLAGYGSFQDFEGGGATPYTLNGSAVTDTGSARLTTTNNNQLGSVIFEPVSPFPVGSFTASFDFRIGPSTGSGADGMSFALMDTVYYGANANFGEDGPAGNALVLSFDTFDNGAPEPGGNFVELRHNGVSVATAIPTFNLEATIWIHAEVFFDGTALTLVLTPAGGSAETTFNAVPVPGYASVQRRHGFGARTGGVNNEHRVDNVRFTVTSHSGDINANAVPDACELYAAWIASYGLTGSNALFGFDFDGDGFANGYEWATGTNPSDDRSFPGLSISSSNGLAVLHFLRNTNAVDTTITVERTENLPSGWTGYATNAYGLWLAPTNVVESGPNSPVLVDLPDVNGANQAFYRLRVNRP